MLRLEARASKGDHEFALTGVRVEGATLDGDKIVSSAVLAFPVPVTTLYWSKGDDRSKEACIVFGW